MIQSAMAYPNGTFAVLARGCDERGLRELFKWKQLTEDRVILIGIGCPDELAKACECEKPFPDSLLEGPQGPRQKTRKSPPLTKWIWKNDSHSGKLNLIAVLSVWVAVISVRCASAMNVHSKKLT